MQRDNHGLCESQRAAPYHQPMAARTRALGRLALIGQAAPVCNCQRQHVAGGEVLGQRIADRHCIHDEPLVGRVDFTERRPLHPG
ncbi:hypothetical protein T31B1_01555 [Salinisphaera sp. T31B1]